MADLPGVTFTAFIFYFNTSDEFSSGVINNFK